MQPNIPAFEGREVQAAAIRFSGRTSQRIGAYNDGEFAIVVAKVKISKISHQDFKAGSGANSPSLYTRVHDTSTTRAVVLPVDKAQTLLEQFIEAADDEFGIESLFSSDEGSDETEHEG